MASRLRQERTERLDQAVQQIRSRLGAEAAEAEAFLRLYYSHVADEDVAGQSPEALAGQAVSLWKFGALRQPGTVKLRASNPAAASQGWQSAHTVLEIVNDDMPFLVDSVSGALTMMGLTVHLVIHPVARVERDEAGRRLPATGTGSLAESMMHVEIDQQLDAKILTDIETGMHAVLADVRAAVEDWRAMLAKLADCEKVLAEQPPPLPPEEIAEGRALLAWMADRNFTFLGYRDYDYNHALGEEAFAVVPESGLGILRDPTRRLMRIAGTNQSAADIAPEVRELLQAPELLIILKANLRSTVHRTVYLDYIAVKRFDAQGQVVGERRFTGLFTSTAYSTTPRDIPYLRRKVQRVLERAGLPLDSHDGKALTNILETYPRDELFQISEDDLLRISLGILSLQERPRIRLFVREDKYQRFVSCLVFTPRERFSTELRRKFEAILAAAFDGRISAFYTQIGDDPLARIQFIIVTTPGSIPRVEIEDVEARLTRAARLWSDDLHDALVQQHGEAEGNRLARRYAQGFGSFYRETFDANAALFDLGKLESLSPDGPNNMGFNLYRAIGANESEVNFKLYRAGDAVPLSDCLPMLENMGLKVMEEQPFAIQLADGVNFSIQDFHLRDRAGNPVALDAVKQKFENAFAAVANGLAEDDGFNRLVLLASLDWHDIVVLRAVAKYLRQAGAAFSQTYMESALANNARVAALLIALFHARLDPKAEGDRAAAEAAICAEIETALEQVASLDEDRILRRFLNIIHVIWRTNFWQRDAAGQPKPYLSFKVDSGQVEELPAPRPFTEIFVYSPRFEAVHLRGGKVARGGIRWSDRREDFRTEILGLMKAQMVKNAVIVPVGAKGGFVPKRPPAPTGVPDKDREALLADGIACYKTFMAGLFDITDNLAGANVVPPPDVVRHDGDDPYLVVAADKGTATFSDIANGISLERGFWLGDAFASGGSAGYDHKKMGITARGAWELVKRHFRELGRDIQVEPFTVVGIGDMSGDVFGNGMMLSPQIHLLAAFDHRHIFVDPAPDPAVSLAERQRLFALPRSSWMDYNPAKLSKGAQIYDRKAKSLKLTPEIKARFALDRDAMTPSELIRALLLAEADLLWIGGIGTYVKSHDETNLQVGDRANDAHRVNGNELRAKVVGEGGNLGCTQRGRIDYALNGGRINTDAVDNSAGVDTSDHEVNIKILTDQLTAEGDMTAKQRDKLLVDMTDELGGLVLQDNYLQGQAVSLAISDGPAALEQQTRFMRGLEKQGRLDRAIEYLPDEEVLIQRRGAHIGLTRPELAVLLAYAKTTLYADLLASDLPDDPYFAADLARYFPRLLRKNYAKPIQQHRLRREIVGTSVANSIVNRGGITFVSQIAEELQAEPAIIARAYTIARDVFHLRPVWGAIQSLDNEVSAAVQIDMHRAVRQLHRRATLWFLKNRPVEAGTRFAIAPAIEAFQPGVAELAGHLEPLLSGAAAAAVAARREELLIAHVPSDLVEELVELGPLGSSLDIVATGRAVKQPVLAVAGVYFATGDRLGIDWLRTAAESLSPPGYWDRLALAALVDDLYRQQRQLTALILKSAVGDSGAAAVAAWTNAHAGAVARLDQLIGEFRTAGALDLAQLAIASRAIADLAAT